MRLKTLVLACAFLLPVIVSAQAEHEASGHESAEGEHHDNSTLWKIANFAILAAAIGYGVAKAAPAFFRGRTREIQSGIAEATKLRQDAEARAADMERRMRNLNTEIEEMRNTSRRELEAEDRRIAGETEQLIARVRANAEQEIASATKQARKELRAYSAELALELARQKIRSRMTPELADNLIDTFTRDLGDVSQRAN